MFRRVFFLALALAFVATAAHASQTDEPQGGSETNEMGYIVSIGLAPLFFDQEQFNDEIEALDIGTLPFAAAGQLSFGRDVGQGPHFFRAINTFTTNNQVSHHKGDSADLSFWYFDIAFGWRYQATSWFSFHADAGFAFGNWKYVVIDESFNGQAAGRLLGFTPRAGLLFRALPTLAFDLHGGYTGFFSERGEYYSGDMSRNEYDDFDFNHAYVGLNFVFLVESRFDKRRGHN
ncbi:MAG: hypothetical protein P9L99_15940 [Candidatus Lernaella stagnicola]|nr:hypothetical protein [Candidatus Lernaella stagnicola]